MNTHTINTYSLEELKAQFPEGYARALKEWAERDTEIPWSDETIESLKAAVEACGATLRDFSIGAYCHSYVKVYVDDTEEFEVVDSTGDVGTNYIKKDAEWFKREVLAKIGNKNLDDYLDKDGNVCFPGNCSLTGCSSDDDILEHIYKELLSGDTLSVALSSLGYHISKIFEKEVEYQASEENFLQMNEDTEYTADGEEWY